MIGVESSNGKENYDTLNKVGATQAADKATVVNPFNVTAQHDNDIQVLSTLVHQLQVDLKISEG